MKLTNLHKPKPDTYVQLRPLTQLEKESLRQEMQSSSQEIRQLLNIRKPIIRKVRRPIQVKAINQDI